MIRDPRFSSYASDGSLKSESELRALADEVARNLTEDEASALTQMDEAVSASVNWMVEISLRRKGLIGWPRSGDNAFPLTPLGVTVASLLATGTAWSCR